MIQEWLAGRYQRAALPSALQRQLKPVQDKLRKLAAKLTDASILFIALGSQDKLGDEEAYRLSVILALPTEEYGQQARLRAMEKLHMELMGLFAQCAGIDLDEAESKVESEENISLAALRYLLRWEEFDYVSYQDRATHQPPYPGLRMALSLAAGQPTNPGEEFGQEVAHPQKFVRRSMSAYRLATCSA